jgi:cytochrome c biogenesis protein CcmG/thiol:disulfide interchange protein DsbE
VKRWLAFSPLIVLAVLALMFLAFSLKRNPEVTPEAMVGKPVPAITLASLDDGAPTPLTSTLQGVTLVNFFASWCAPCEIEHPTLSALKAEGVRIVGIAYKDEPEKTKTFLARLGDPFAARLVDQDGRAGVDFGATGVPETYLVGADGRILGKFAGPLDADKAEDLLSKAR